MEKRCGKDMKKFRPMVIAVLIFVLYLFMLNQNPWRDFSIRSESAGTVHHVENPWQLQKQGEEAGEKVQLPMHIRLEQGEIYTLTSRLSYDGAQDEMPYGFIHVDHLYCRILLEDQVLFSCMPEDKNRWDRAKSPGFIFKAFPLPRDCMGKTMTIELLPPLTTPVEYGLPDISFGDYTSTLHQTVLWDMPHDVVTILCAMLGVGSILFSTVALKDREYREGLSIGIFSLIFSLYLVTECDFNVYFIENPYYTYLVNYLAFSLLPVSLMGFMRERLEEKHWKICTAVITAELIFFAGQVICHFMGILDLREFIPVLHIIYFVEMILVTILIQSQKDKKKKRGFLIQISPALAGMLADAAIYWMHLDIGGNDATFTIVGVAIFLVIELFHIGRSGVTIYTESVRSRLYRQMAFVDELTQVGNRRAYDQEIGAISTEQKEYDSMIVVSADVNRLKYVNDHFGHGAGDCLISSAAGILKEAAGEWGKVFRTGGDEFSVFLYDVPKDRYDSMMQTVQKKIDAFNEKQTFQMSLAVGYVPNQDHRILEAAQEADRKMYEDKVKQKAVRET